MTLKHKLIQTLKESLSKTNLFIKIDIEGDLDSFPNILIFGYKQNPAISEREFLKEKSSLDKLLIELIENNYPQISMLSVIDKKTKSIKSDNYKELLENCNVDDLGIHRIYLKCLYTGKENNLTNLFIRDINTKIRKSYLHWKGL